MPREVPVAIETCAGRWRRAWPPFVFVGARGLGLGRGRGGPSNGIARLRDGDDGRLCVGLARLVRHGADHCLLAALLVEAQALLREHLARGELHVAGVKATRCTLPAYTRLRAPSCKSRGAGQEAQVWEA